MRNERLARYLMLTSLLGSAPALADDLRTKSGAQTEPRMMQPIVVTATRYQETVESVPANVTLITEQDIANSTARDVPTILQKEVGLHIYDITGNGRSYRVDRSGFGETAALNTLVLVDGRRVNSPNLSGSDWKLIPLDRIERIEIVRGSRGSVLYGDNASDSVVNIITKTGDEQFRAGAKAAAGTFDTLDTNAYVSGMHKGLSYALSGRFSESDGYRDNSETDSRDIGLNLDYAFGDTGRISFSAGYHDDDTNLPGALRDSDLAAGVPRDGTVNPFDYADTEDGYAQLTPEIYLFRDSYFKAPLSYRNRDVEQFASFVGGEFEGNTEVDTATASPQFVIKEPVAGHRNNLTLGFDYFYADQDIVNRSEFFGLTTIGRFDLEKKNYGLYIHDEFYPVDNLALSAGFRYDKVKYDFSSVAPGQPDDTDYDENLFTAGVNYRFQPRSHVYASYSEGFRYPVLDELFSFFTNTINTDLRPQTSDNYEIGIRHYFNDNSYGNVNLFRMDTNDELFFNPSTFQNENLDAETRRDGVEVSLGYDAAAVSIKGSYTYRDTEIRGGAFSGNEVPNVPEHQGSLELLWRPLPRLDVNLNGIYVGKRYFESDYANGFRKQDDYTVVNTKLQYRVNKATLFLDVNNLFDEEYEAYGVLATTPVEAAIYPSPDRSFLAGIRYDY